MTPARSGIGLTVRRKPLTKQNLSYKISVEPKRYTLYGCVKSIIGLGPYTVGVKIKEKLRFSVCSRIGGARFATTEVLFSQYFIY